MKDHSHAAGARVGAQRAAAPPNAHPILGVFALLLTATLWSLSGPLIKIVGAAAVPGETIACYRSIFSGLILLPLAASRVPTLARVSVGWPIAAVICFTLMTGAFVKATTLTSAATAILLQYTAPVWVFLLSPALLGERPTRREGGVLLLCMLGVAVIVAGAPPADATGMLYALSSGAGYGALIVILRGMRGVDPLVVTVLNSLGSGLLLLVPVALSGVFAVTAHNLFLIAVMGVVQFTLPYVIFSWALRHVEAHRASLIVLLETVLNPVWTFLAVGEIPPAATLLGGPLIVAGVAAWLWLALLRERRALRTPIAAPPNGE